jgi:hypothetical protein
MAGRYSGAFTRSAEVMEIPIKGGSFMMYTRIIRPTILMMTVALGSIAWGVQMPPSINNDRDLKSALKAAKTPEDHERIAAYYKAKGERLNAEAAEYQEAAMTYRNGPVVKNLTAPNTAARYEYIAEGLREEAKTNRKLAASQAQMAKDAERAFK